MTGRKAAPHEGTKEKVIDEHPIPSGNIGRVRSAAMDIHE
jgi:hypothetical protein